jgi:hypothetical protein
MKQKFNAQKLIDDSPTWLKSGYVALMRHTKSALHLSGILQRLDKKAQHNRGFHYVRSLLAIHDIPDMIGLDVPWWTYSSIDYIKSYLETCKHPINVFEWGSGASTIWLAKRVDKVMTIEHDPKWHEIIRPFLSSYPHVHSILKEPDRLLVDGTFESSKVPGVNFKPYVEAIHPYSDKFDIIVIDGRARSACLQVCLPYLKSDGIIVFDNSNRHEYQQALDHSGLIINRYKGKVPGSPLTGETAILRRSTET